MTDGICPSCTHPWAVHNDTGCTACPCASASFNYDPSLPYGGTQGWSGTDTSKERAERDVKEGTATKRQRWVLGRLNLRGYAGLTVAELRDDTGWHHGVASSILTVLHKDNRIVRLAERRGRCKVYVRPQYVDDREVSPYKPNSTHKEEADRLRAGIEALADGWDLAADPGKWKCADELRALLDNRTDEHNA